MKGYSKYISRFKKSRAKDFDRQPIPLNDYCRLNNITNSGARYQLSVGKLAGFKFKGQWYVFV